MTEEFNLRKIMNSEENNYYIEPDDLEEEIIKWQETDEMSEELGIMFMKIAKGLSYKSKYLNYSNHWKDGMIEKALIHLCSYAKNYDPDYENTNPFNYCTTIADNAFKQYIEKEKKHSKLKNDLYDIGKSIMENWKKHEKQNEQENINNR